MISSYIRDTILGEIMTNNKINFITISETSHTQPDKSSDWDYEGFVKSQKRAYFAKRNLLAHVRSNHMTRTKRSEQEGKEEETTHEVSHQADVDRLEYQTDGSHTRTPYLLEKGKEVSASVSDGDAGLCVKS